MQFFGLLILYKASSLTCNAGDTLPLPYAASTHVKWKRRLKGQNNKKYPSPFSYDKLIAFSKQTFTNRPLSLTEKLVCTFLARVVR